MCIRDRDSSNQRYCLHAENRDAVLPCKLVLFPDQQPVLFYQTSIRCDRPSQPEPGQADPDMHIFRLLQDVYKRQLLMVLLQIIRALLFMQYLRTTAISALLMYRMI